MKNIIRKIKDWLIGKLGGYTLEAVWARSDGEINAYIKMHAKIVNAWRKVVQEICRKSDDTYYDWCCEYCNMTCDKRNGWCEKFMPAERQVFGDNIHRGGIDNERCC